MPKIIFSALLLFLAALSVQVSAQQVSPEEKAQQAAGDMQKRLGLKENQLQYIYSINLIKIQKTRKVKVERADNHKKLGRDYLAISEEYNLRLRSILTPEQYQRWEILREEAQERRKVLEQNLLANNTISLSPLLADPEAELDHLITQ